MHEPNLKPGGYAMNQISLLLENRDVQAVDGVTFDRLNPVTGDVATRASAAQIADAKRAADAAAAKDIAQGRRRARGQDAAIHRTDGHRNRCDRRLGRI
jgi:acyl-CoA reductase-like NAD-dependent aldehyde dehydrogenase